MYKQHLHILAWRSERSPLVFVYFTRTVLQNIYLIFEWNWKAEELIFIYFTWNFWAEYIPDVCVKLESQRTYFSLFYPELSCRIISWCLREPGKPKNWFLFISPGPFLQNIYLMSAWKWKAEELIFVYFTWNFLAKYLPDVCVKMESWRTDFCLFYPEHSCRISTRCLHETGKPKNWFFFTLPGTFLQNIYKMSAWNWKTEELIFSLLYP